MEKKKKVMIIVVTVLVLTIGVTFAYFMARTGAGASANANITADTVDDLKFSVSKDSLSLNINQFNFASGSGNLSDSITAIASLKANSTKKTATSSYYVYFQIESNNYIYTSEEGYNPEIILSITGPNGEVTALDNLFYTSAKNADGTIVKGFDITTLGASIIKVADSYEISSSTSTNYTNQEWTFTVTFINLDTNQADNEGKTLKGKVLIQKEKIPETIADVATNGDNLTTILEIFGTKSASNLSDLYYHNGIINDEDGNIIDAGDNSYRYAGEKHPDYYSCDYNGNYVLNYKSSNVNHSLKDDCSKIYKVTLNNKIEYYDKSLEKFYYNKYSVSWDSINNKCLTSDGFIVYDVGFNEVIDSTKCIGTAYQYLDTKYYQIGIEEVGSGIETLASKEKEINNYVCFGSDSETCPNENLYRIIGLIDGKIKLILADGATTDMLGTDGTYEYTYDNSEHYKGNGDLSKIGMYFWNSEGTNIWENSDLNKINLNKNYLTYLDGKDAKWKNMIADTTWYVGGMTGANGVQSNAKTTYDYEAGANKTSTTVTSKIGLMYVSDYYYGATPNYWTLPGYNLNGIDYREAINDNWMYIGLREQTISPIDYISLNNLTKNSTNLKVVPQSSAPSPVSYYIGESGSVYDSGSFHAVRPVFNLISTIKYVSGDGSIDSPIRLSL